MTIFSRQFIATLTCLLFLSPSVSAEQIVSIMETGQFQLTFSYEGQYSLLVARYGNEKDYLVIMDTNDVQELAGGIAEAVSVLQNTHPSTQIDEPLLLRSLPLGKVSVAAIRGVDGIKTVMLTVQDPFHQSPVVINIPLVGPHDAESLMTFFGDTTDTETWGTRYAIPWKPHRWHP